MQSIHSSLLDLLLMAEVSRAKEIHGTGFATHHDAYGVLAEEVQEAQDELRTITQYMEALLRYIRADDVSGCRDALPAIRRTAMNAAMECTQVAAVCQKWLDWMGGVPHE